MKKKSFINTIKVLIGIQLLMVMLIVIFFAAFTYQSATREMNSVAENFLDIYVTQIENRIMRMDQNLTTILNNNADLSLLESDELAERNRASVRLSNTIQDIMKIDDSAEMLVIAEMEYDICLDAKCEGLSFDRKNEIREFIMAYMETAEHSGGWEFGFIGDTAYLYKILIWNHRSVAAFVSADALLATIPDVQINNCSFILTDGDDEIWGYSGYENFDGELGIQLTELPSKHMMINQASIMSGQINLYAFEEKTAAFSRLRVSAVLLLCVVILLGVFDFVFSRIVRKDLILPMNNMRKDMKHIEEGEYGLRVKEMGDNQEFFMLAQSFNKLMDEILNLRIQFYEKKLELSDAEQKYIRLQIRPHFFLNALTTIASLSFQGKNKDIDIYINALSKNIRYMFSSGLHTVSVKEEIYHVKNYFEMQELKYPGCVFYYIDMPEELESWKIPQMMIHTLVENEYKYAVSTEASLMILIKVSAETVSGERMLMIEVEDDGPGYPPDVLEYINQDTGKRQDGTQVGLWSIKRLLELMYDRKGIFKFEKNGPHGAFK
ncbi:MAG: histidine kinase, partial [Lachnospiraceae bacterium]|nr:histidine kinase [Lachnospiraceae bacterium]